MNLMTTNKFSRVSFCSNNIEQKSSVAQNNTVVWPKEFTQVNLKTYTHTTLQEEEKKIFKLNDINSNAATSAAGSAIILRFAHNCIEKLSQICAQILMRGKEFAPKDDVIKVAKEMKNKNNLNAQIFFIDNANKDFFKDQLPSLSEQFDMVAEGKNAFYSNIHNFTIAPKSRPSLILHELGHAINSEKSKIFKTLQNLRIVGAFAPMAVVFLNKITGSNKDGKESFIEKHAGLIGFSAFLPTIIEEAMASFRGIKAAKNMLPKANLGILKKNYFFAWMTYVLAGVATGILSKLAIAEQKEKQNRINNVNKQKRNQN